MKNLIIILLSILVFTSCTQDINIWPPYYQTNKTNSKGEYEIGGYVAAAATRAAVSSTYDDKFSLFAWTTGTQEVLNSDSTVMNNYHGVFKSNQTWGYTEPVKYFDNFVNEYNFIGIIPQSDSHTYSNHSVTVSANIFGLNTNEGDYTGYDDREVLYATTSVQKENYSQGASLSFQHANAKICLRFKSDDPNTQIIDYSPYTPGSPTIPNVPGDTTINTINTKALDALKDGYIIGWPYDADNQPSADSGNPRFTINNFGGMTQEIADKVNAQFIYYTDAKGTIVKTSDFGSANKKNKIYIKLASSVNGNDEFIANASEQLKTDYRVKACYDNGWRVVKIDKSYGGWTLWFLSNTSQEISVTTITGGTSYQPAIPAAGKEGIVVLPATSANQTGTDAKLSTYPSNANITVSLNGLSWEQTATDSIFTFAKPNATISTTVSSPTIWFPFPKFVNTNNLGYTVKFSYIYKGVNVYDARIYIPASDVQWESGKSYTYIINIKGRGNGKTEPNNDIYDPVIPIVNNYEIKGPANIIDYEDEKIYNYDIK